MRDRQNRPTNGRKGENIKGGGGGGGGQNTVFHMSGIFMQFWAFQIWKLRGKPLNWEICYTCSLQFRHFWSIKKQISYYIYYCHSIEGEIRCNGSRM